jgi:hypothetical protein
MEVAMGSTCSSYEGAGDMYDIFVGKALGRGQLEGQEGGY